MVRCVKANTTTGHSACRAFASVVFLAVFVTGVTAAPLNDDCQDAAQIGDGTFSFSTIGATTDGFSHSLCDEFASNQVYQDIWYQHFADCTGELTVTLCGSLYDTKLALYDGCDLAACPPTAAPLDCDDDGCGIPGGGSQLTVSVVRSECYLIRIGGWSANDSGDGTMTISCDVPPPPTGACCDAGTCIGTMTEDVCGSAGGTWVEAQTCPEFACPVDPPAHDDCIESIEVFTEIPFSGTTTGAGGVDVTAAPCGFDDTRDVWHRWTADCTGSTTISLCDGDSFFDTTLAAFDACDGNELECNDDFCGGLGIQSRITLDVTSGVTYYFRVAGHDMQSGDYTLNVETCLVGPPTGACCFLYSGFPDPFCTGLTLEVCDSFSGAWFGPESACEDSLCWLDLDDYAMFADCMSGPGVAPVPTPPTTPDECLWAFDADDDNDVDSSDGAAFIDMFRGPAP